MNRFDWIENLSLKAIDMFYGSLPRPRPSVESAANARVIAHRGDHSHALENTMQAFEDARACGCWGIEFDVRWTRDGAPVVHHDIQTGRVFQGAHDVATLTASQLRKAYPQIPFLEEVVSEFAPHTHLLIEVKTLIPQAGEKLRAILKNLEPQKDFHFISLEPELLIEMQAAPPAACLPISGTNARQIHQSVNQMGFGGMLAQYAFCSNEMIAEQNHSGRVIGTGFVDSRNVLYRELGRGVKWLFTNNPAHINRELRQLLNTAPAPLANQHNHHKHSKQRS